MWESEFVLFTGEQDFSKHWNNTAAAERHLFTETPTFRLFMWKTVEAAVHFAEAAEQHYFLHMQISQNSIFRAFLCHFFRCNNDLMTHPAPVGVYYFSPSLLRFLWVELGCMSGRQPPLATISSSCDCLLHRTIWEISPGRSTSTTNKPPKNKYGRSFIC